MSLTDNVDIASLIISNRKINKILAIRRARNIEVIVSGNAGKMDGGLDWAHIANFANSIAQFVVL